MDCSALQRQLQIAEDLVLEARHAKHVADRDRLSKELANHSYGFIGSGRREQRPIWILRRGCRETCRSEVIEGRRRVVRSGG